MSSVSGFHVTVRMPAIHIRHLEHTSETSPSLEEGASGVSLSEAASPELRPSKTELNNLTQSAMKQHAKATDHLSCRQVDTQITPQQ